jgi:hypothetical protein
MASERILQDGDEWEWRGWKVGHVLVTRSPSPPSPTGDHITLPLDPALLNDAGVEAAARVIYRDEFFDSRGPSQRANLLGCARAAIAAYAAALGEEG